MGWLSVSAIAGGVVAGLLVLGYRIERLLESRDDQLHPPQGQMIDVGGHRLHLLCKGDAAGPTVVIEQGAGGGSPLWWPIQDEVSRFARVCTYDRAGQFWSDPAASLPAAEAQAAELHALLGKARIPGPYILVGHSFGGVLVRLFARDFPNDVAGVVLVDTVDEGIVFADYFSRYLKKFGFTLGLARIGAEFGVLRLATSFASDDGETASLGPETQSVLKAMTFARPGYFRGMRDDFQILLNFAKDPHSPRDLGPLGDRPLVVITHGQPFQGPAAVLEQGWQAAQERQSKLSTRGELLRAAKSNHMINLDEPDLVIDAIRRVYDTVRGYPAS
jgi:pimeloyl-ACP methyl ester carboxylesterase